MEPVMFIWSHSKFSLLLHILVQIWSTLREFPLDILETMKQAKLCLNLFEHFSKEFLLLQIT